LTEHLAQWQSNRAPTNEQALVRNSMMGPMGAAPMTGRSGLSRDLFDVVMLDAYLIARLVCHVWLICDWLIIEG
jgi:hypothetical protein